MVSNVKHHHQTLANLHMNALVYPLILQCIRITVVFACDLVCTHDIAQCTEVNSQCVTHAVMPQVLRRVGCAVECCQRGTSWLQLLHVTHLWWNLAPTILNRVRLLALINCTN